MTNFKDGIYKEDVSRLKNVENLKLVLPIEAYVDEGNISSSHSVTKITCKNSAIKFPFLATCTKRLQELKYFRILEELLKECEKYGIYVEIYACWSL